MCSHCEVAACSECGQTDWTPEHAFDDFGRCAECSLVCCECEEAVEGADDLDPYGRCETCTITCDECGRSLESTEEIDEYGRCEDCSLTCDECGYVCESHDEYGRCDECRVYCDECGECVAWTDDNHCCEHCSTQGGLRCYSYQPENLRFLKLPGEKTREFYGIECEFELEDADVPEEPDGWYLKSDGSLSNGAEAVSHPGTLAYWLSPDRFAWAKEAASEGCRAWSTTTAGMHVHVSRDVVSKLDILKIAKLFAENEQWVVKLSGRRSLSALQHWSDPGYGPGYSPARKAKGFSAKRYEALNTCNPRTVEFRIFRGTLKPEAIARNVLIVHSLLAWARQVSLADVKVESYVRFVRECRTLKNVHKKAILERAA